MYSDIHRNSKAPYFPRVRHFESNEQYHILVLDLLKGSLRDYIKLSTPSQADIKTLAIALIKCLKELHRIGYVHRDLKPANIMFASLDDESRPVLIDFGLTKRFRTAAGHEPKERRNGMIGTLRYVSINCHRQITLSARDDMQSLMFIIAFVLYGHLPWQLDKKERHEISKKAQYARVWKLKKKYCRKLFKPRDQVFQLIMDDILNLKFAQSPRYDRYVRMLSI